jgi:hypothetical protein
VSPVGEWLVEDGEARIRIEECANNLCGVVSSAKNANETDRKNPKPELRNRPIIGLPVLLDMKPAAVNRWEGRIYNAKNGQTYTAHISLIDPERLRVEGCVFGGFICGGQNWTRVNWRWSVSSQKWEPVLRSGSKISHLSPPAVEAPAAPSTAVFPSAISPTYANEKPYKARLKTCSDQYKANKATNANGGLKWIQKGGGYRDECNKHLKGWRPDWST